jgi:hypothetical protein
LHDLPIIDVVNADEERFEPRLGGSTGPLVVEAG